MWDAICQQGSYGYEDGLLEICGDIVETKDDIVEGYLTAQDVIERIERRGYSMQSIGAFLLSKNTLWDKDEMKGEIDGTID